MTAELPNVTAGGPINPPVQFADPRNGSTVINYTRYVDRVPAFQGQYIKSATADTTGQTVWKWVSDERK